MKIAIVTLYDAYNCGSFLQAFAIYQYCKRYNDDTVLLDCSKDKLRWIKRIIASPQKQFAKIKKRISYGKAWKKLDIRRFNPDEKWDLIIVGSDEVWNVENPFFEHWEQYFGTGIDSKKIIAYAPSIGFCDVDRLTQDSSIMSSIADFTDCYARDKNTKLLMEKALKRKVERVCDPTLLLYDSWKQWEEAIEINKPYLMIYSYGSLDKYKEEIIEYAREKELLLLSVAFACEWAHQVVFPTPFQFLYLVHHAKAVVGTTFHISLFATMYNQKFCIITEMQKTVDFMQISNQTNRLYKKSGDLKQILEMKNDFILEDSELNSLVSKSKMILREHIGETIA